MREADAKGTGYIIPLTSLFQNRHNASTGIDVRTVVPLERRRLTKKWHERTFRADGNVLYPDWGVGK